MTAPVAPMEARCAVCGDTGSKSQDIDGHQDCTACDAVERRAHVMGYLRELSPYMTVDSKAWAAYLFAQRQAAPVEARKADSEIWHVQKLRDAAADPMWAGHAEVSKSILIGAANIIEAAGARIAALKAAAPVAPQPTAVEEQEPKQLIVRIWPDGRVGISEMPVDQEWGGDVKAAPQPEQVEAATMPVHEADQLIELAGALEQEWLRKTIAELRAMKFREGPFQAGFETAIDEIETRCNLAAPQLEAQQAGDVEEQARGEGWLRAMSDVSALLPSTYYMDPPDGGSVTVLEQVQRMAKDAERYRWLKECNSGSIVIVHLVAPDEEVVLTEIDADISIDAAIAQGRKA